MTTFRRPAKKFESTAPVDKQSEIDTGKRRSSIGEQLAALPGNMKASLVIQALGLDLAGKKGGVLLRQSPNRNQKSSLLTDLSPELISNLLVEFSGALKRRTAGANDKAAKARNENQSVVNKVKPRETRSSHAKDTARQTPAPDFARDIAAEHPIIGAITLMDYPTEVVTQVLREMRPKNAQRIALCTAELEGISNPAREKIRSLIQRGPKNLAQF
jgi:flagellar motor switch protein FliG